MNAMTFICKTPTLVS